MPSLVARTARMVMRCYPFPRGQGRLIDRTPLHALRFDEASLLVRTVDGFSIEVFPNDHIGRHLYLTGQFDRTIVEVLLRFAVPDARALRRQLWVRRLRPAAPAAGVPRATPEPAGWSPAPTGHRAVCPPPTASR